MEGGLLVHPEHDKEEGSQVVNIFKSALVMKVRAVNDTSRESSAIKNITHRIDSNKYANFIYISYREFFTHSHIS